MTEGIRAHHVGIVKKLRAAGHTAGMSPEGRAVLLYEGLVWRVMGGDFLHPSMMKVDVDPAEVDWGTP